jgi:hypothetical protein
MNEVTANRMPVEVQLPCSIEEFQVAQKLLLRGVGVANVTLAVPGMRS